MSQYVTDSAPLIGKKTHGKNYKKQCILVLEHGQGPVIGSFDGTSDITITFIQFFAVDKRDYRGFSIELPFGPNTENEGFGKCHIYNREVSDTTPGPYKIMVKFPLKSMNVVAEEIPLELRSKLPDRGKKMCLLRASLDDDAIIEGYGTPFSHPGHPSDAWINNNAPIVDGHTLSDILSARTFCLVFPEYLPVFRAKCLTDNFQYSRYPHRVSQEWNEEELKMESEEFKGIPFQQSFTFDDNDSHLVAMSRSQSQDILWLYEDACKIQDRILPAYFIKRLKATGDQFFGVIAVEKDFKRMFDSAWRQLASCKLDVEFWIQEDDDVKSRCATWQAKLVESSKWISELFNHPTEAFEIVVLICRPLDDQAKRVPDFEPTSFDSRSAANARGPNKQSVINQY